MSNKDLLILESNNVYKLLNRLNADKPGLYNQIAFSIWHKGRGEIQITDLFRLQADLLIQEYEKLFYGKRVINLNHLYEKSLSK